MERAGMMVLISDVIITEMAAFLVLSRAPESNLAECRDVRDSSDFWSAFFIVPVVPAVADVPAVFLVQTPPISVQCRLARICQNRVS